MPTYESLLQVATNKERVGGRVTIGISRLPLVLILEYIFKGHTEKDLKAGYPRIKQDEYRVLSRLAKDLKKYGFELKDK